jgi:hypothetical protein
LKSNSKQEFVIEERRLAQIGEQKRGHMRMRMMTNLEVAEGKSPVEDD